MLLIGVIMIVESDEDANVESIIRGWSAVTVAICVGIHSNSCRRQSHRDFLFKGTLICMIPIDILLLFIFKHITCDGLALELLSQMTTINDVISFASLHSVSKQSSAVPLIGTNLKPLVTHSRLLLLGSTMTAEVCFMSIKDTAVLYTSCAASLCLIIRFFLLYHNTMFYVEIIHSQSIRPHQLEEIVVPHVVLINAL
uniref:Transmembrane protein n=1 Tax=Heterorhabditis bacteriophora TaxID=37862 RepID=A0A1I7WVJ1_HETBA